MDGKELIVDAGMDRAKIEADLIDRLEKGFRGDTSHVYPDWIYEARRAVAQRDSLIQEALRWPAINPDDSEGGSHD